jgi:hypothetical protein
MTSETRTLIDVATFSAWSATVWSCPVALQPGFSACPGEFAGARFLGPTCRDRKKMPPGIRAGEHVMLGSIRHRNLALAGARNATGQEWA